MKYEQKDSVEFEKSAKGKEGWLISNQGHQIAGIGLYWWYSFYGQVGDVVLKYSIKMALDGLRVEDVSDIGGMDDLQKNWYGLNKK